MVFDRVFINVMPHPFNTIRVELHTCIWQDLMIHCRLNSYFRRKSVPSTVIKQLSVVKSLNHGQLEIIICSCRYQLCSAISYQEKEKHSSLVRYFEHLEDNMPIVILTAVHQTYFFQRMVKIFPRQACFSQYSLVLPLQTIPCLCSELAQLQGTYILQGLLMIFTLLSLAYMIRVVSFL